MFIDGRWQPNFLVSAHDAPAPDYVVDHVECPHQHANVHFHRTDHPVMRSVEPGESWRWCYVDIRLD